MTQLDRIEAKLDYLRWVINYGKLWAPSGKYMILHPETHEVLSGPHEVPPQPKWPEVE